MSTNSVADLAATVRRHLLTKKAASLRLTTLTRFFESIYLTSLKTEEGRPLRVRIALVDPNNRDPDFPPAPRPSRWQFVELKNRLPLTVSNLAKLAAAADPWSCCLAAYFDASERFFIWGMVDQTVHFSTMLVRERESGYAQPGLFNVITSGPADITVYRGWGFVARLAQDRLVRRQNNVFWSGPISDRLSPGIERYIQTVLTPFPKEEWEDSRPGYLPYTAELWISTLCRVLISIQRYGHGGALLITRSDSDLDVKYPLDYSRLPKALINLGVSRLRARRAHFEILSEYIKKRRGDVPRNWYFEQTISESREEDLQDEVTGCVRFISSLSCVDGLILAGSDLSVRGFGVEIQLKKEVKSLYLASSPTPKPKSLTRIQSNYYGTRHRSMMRYCMDHPDSVGFVVSQDGEIRAIAKVGRRIMMWENLQVHSLHEEVPRKKLSPEAFRLLRGKLGASASRFFADIPERESKGDR